MNEQSVNNRVLLVGNVCSTPKYTHELYGEGFYEFFINVPRLSGIGDVIPVTVSERLLIGKTLNEGEKIAISGQFRSYNKLVEEKSKLMLTVFVRDFLDPDDELDNPNQVELNGYVCKPPIYRITPFNREICDVLVAVNRGYNKSDYIPCIAWGRNARFVKNISVGQNIVVTGRIQSRKYNKRISETLTQERTAYELSVSKISCDTVTPSLDLYADSSTTEIG